MNTTSDPGHSQVMREFIEHKGWKNNIPSTGVTWDGTCSKCKFSLANKPLISGKVAIEGDGRRIARVASYFRISGETFRSTSHVLACSKCVPSIMQMSDS